jgi:predicted PurR-regulated permease PerM
MTTAPHRTDIARTLLTIGITILLLIGSVRVLSPFLLAFLWATMIVVASWPVMIALERHLGGRRWLAVCLMILGLLIALFLPLILLVTTLIDNSAQIVTLAASLKTLSIPHAPAWLTGLPYFGVKLGQFWEQSATLGIQGLADKAAPYAGDLTRWFASRIGGFGVVTVQTMLSIGISAILYAQGEAAFSLLDRFARKLGGTKGSDMVHLAAGAIRGVALGVCLTALIQALLAGLGLIICGIPFAILLTALLFMLCIAQIGVLPVLLPATIWLYASGQSVLGTFLLIWMLIVMNLDTFLRPWLIRRGADLPLLLIFVGVIGGIIKLGLVGIFLGPLLLAISYTLFHSWLNTETNEVQSPPPVNPSLGSICDPDTPEHPTN